ncbi:MAG: glutathione transferase [Gammaproteobacteria bacterium]|nr:glutathione transferase [Gammaproteobacteria bacterium]
MITGLNHITLAVTHLSTSLEFYCDLLGFRKVHEWENGAYIEAAGLWLCLSLGDVVISGRDYSHIAFSSDQASLLKLRVAFANKKVRCWKENNSEGDSIYFLDPDGHRLEIHVGSLITRMEYLNQSIKK